MDDEVEILDRAIYFIFIHSYDESYTCCINEKEPEVMVLKDKYSLCEDLKYILSIPDLCDVTFLVGPEHYPIHGLRAILASRSRVFYQMILVKEKEVKMKQAQKKVGFLKKLKQIRKFMKTKSEVSQTQSPGKLSITLEEYDPSVFERLIRYIHCGIVSVDVFSVIGLLDAAEKFEFDCLQNACWEFAVSCIRPETVHELIASANQYPRSETAKLLLNNIQDMSVNKPESLFFTPARKSGTRDNGDCKQRGITTNGLLMRTVL